MSSLELVSCAVYVRNRKAALAWYREKLGARPVSDDPEHWTTVRFGRRGSLLHLCEPGGGRVLKRGDVGESGLQLEVAGDFRSFCRSLAAKGVRFSLPPTEAPWGWIARFYDLDGNEFWLRPKARATA